MFFERYISNSPVKTSSLLTKLLTSTEVLPDSSIFDVKKEHVFKRNNIARGHHVFAQANSLAVAVINDELALTAKANIQFKRSVNLNERVIAKARVTRIEDSGRTFVEVNSFVNNELVFTGELEMYRSKNN